MSLERLDWNPSVALAIYAHPGDADISCGGTLARWARAGAEVHLVVCARGEKGSNDTTLSEVELVEQRAAEVRASSDELGIAAVHLLDGSDGELENTLALRSSIVEVIRSVRPEALVCPDPTAVFFGEHYYNHRDHRVVGWTALDAAAPAAAMARYFPSAGPPHQVELALLSGSLEPTVAVEIAATIDDKAAAVARNASQLADGGAEFGGVVHDRAADVGALVGVRFAEAFRRIFLGH
jgi:LmbE family N-acetylglucosaminyl deacetylase